MEEGSEKPVKTRGSVKEKWHGTRKPSERPFVFPLHLQAKKNLFSAAVSFHASPGSEGRVVGWNSGVVSFHRIAWAVLSGTQEPYVG